MEQLIDQTEAAKVLGVEPRTLEGWRYHGIGPAFIRLSERAVRYKLSALERWLSEQTFGVDYLATQRTKRRAKRVVVANSPDTVPAKAEAEP